MEEEQEEVVVVRGITRGMAAAEETTAAETAGTMTADPRQGLCVCVCVWVCTICDCRLVLAVRHELESNRHESLSFAALPGVASWARTRRSTCAGSWVFELFVTARTTGSFARLVLQHSSRSRGLSSKHAHSPCIHVSQKGVSVKEGQRQRERETAQQRKR